MNPGQHGRVNARRVSRRTAIAGGLAVAATPFVPGLTRSWAALGPALDPDTDAEGTQRDGTRAFGFPDPDMTSRVVRPIVFPVRGPVRWTDTYGACRGGCTRSHEGQDLMAGKMQELVACVSGTVSALKHASDGNYLVLRDAEGWFYAYLHINNDTPGTDDGANRYGQAFAPGIALGTTVRQGDVIGYVGDSGNAEATGSHCHFEIRKPAAAWHSAQAVNPKPSLDAAGTLPPKVDPKAFTPWNTAIAFVAQQYLDILGRPADSGGLQQFSVALDRGTMAPAGLTHTLLRSAEFEQYIGPVVRLYLGYFNRVPDAEGLLYWIGQVRRGVPVAHVSDKFAASSEFAAAYAGLDNGGFVERVYQNVLRRSSDPAGKGYWLAQLDAGLTRGGMMLRFTESGEFVARQHHAVGVAMTYIGMLRRSPDTGGYVYWLDQIQNKGMSHITMIQQFQFGDEYRKRFA